MISKLIIWIFNKAFDSKMRNKLEPYIKETYRRMADENLQIRTEIVKVKKGKNRYDLAFFETNDFKLKFNLSRHMSLDFGDKSKVEIEGVLVN